MTCIVGLKDNGKVYIGGDSLATNEHFQKTVRADVKVFTSGEMLYGFCSSFRMGQIIRYSFDAPPRLEDLDDMQYLVGSYIPALMECYEQNKFLRKDEGAEVSGDPFLLGYRGELYLIEEDFQVSKSVLPYESCGIGSDMAKGSLYTSELVEKAIPAKKRVLLALEAAAKHSAAVEPPFNIEYIEHVIKGEK